MNREIIRVIGFWPWLFLVLRLDEVRDWLARVYYCHHNARVIADFEHRMAIVLCECTRGMSKPYYAAEDMVCQIQDYLSEKYDEGYEDGRKSMMDFTAIDTEAKSNLPDSLLPEYEKYKAELIADGRALDDIEAILRGYIAGVLEERYR